MCLGWSIWQYCIRNRNICPVILVVNLIRVGHYSPTQLIAFTGF